MKTVLLKLGSFSFCRKRRKWKATGVSNDGAWVTVSAAGEEGRREGMGKKDLNLKTETHNSG